MNFNQLASEWDQDPQKVERAKAFAKGISENLPKTKKLTGLDFGCGTGLLSFELKNTFEKITLVDISEDMIRVLKDRIIQHEVSNFTPLCTDVFQNGCELQKHDVIYMSMAFHHITNTNNALKSFNNLLNADGFLCIADVVKEDGSFHKHVEDFDGHNGFDRTELTALFEQNGFKEVFYDEVYTIEKEVENQTRKYPLFLMIGQKQ